MGNKSSKQYISGDGSTGNTDAAASLPGGTYTSMELSITCHGLKDSNTYSKMDPFVVIWLLKGTQWVEVTRTEIIDNTMNPCFDSVLARFDVGAIERLRFVVFDNENCGTSDLRHNKAVGEAETTVSEIMNREAWKSDLKKKGSSGSQGTITVSGEKMVDSSVEVVMNMRIEDAEQYEVFSTVQPFLRISRYGGLGGPPMKCAQTNVGKGKSVKFDQLRLTFQHLANSDIHRNLKFELFDFESSGKHVLLADTSMTLVQLQQRITEGKGGLGIPMNNCRKPGKPCATTLMFDYFQAAKVPTLWDYLKAGTDLSFVTAVDFTGSNGESPSFFSSFIKTSQEEKKRDAVETYVSALKEIGGVLTIYDTDGLFPAYGFQGEYCFPLNGNEENPSVPGVQGMVDAFHQALQHVKLVGNTEIVPVIKRAATIAKGPVAFGSIQKYLAMIILTDGSFKDSKAIVEEMATVSALPISFVFIIVGEDSDGSNMKKFEALKKSCRTYTNRDMMQIIPMHSLKDMSTNARSFSIARHMIKELPSQTVEYYTQLKIMPYQSDMGPCNLNHL